MGSFGDIHPYLGLGARLKDRGHRVVVAANAFFERAFQAQGLDFIPLRSSSDYEAFYRRPEHGQPARALMASGRWCGVEPMREVFRVAAEQYEPGQTVMAAPYYAFGARIARESLGIPLATIVLLPYELRSVHRSPVLPRPMVLNDRVPKVVKRMQFWIMDRLFADRAVGRDVNAFRAELGLQPIKRLLAGWCFSPDRVVGFFPEWYAPSQPDWPAQTILTGFPRWDPAGALEAHPELLRFLAAGAPPLVFTLGSYPQYARRFYRAAVEGCMALERRGILLSRHGDALPDELPEHVRRFDYVPLAPLLPKCAAIVSHGGIGTIAQALAAGVPQLLMPIAYNHPDDAVRLKRLGVADYVAPSRFRGPQLAKRLGRLLDSPRVAAQCRALASHFRNVDPILRACVLLESMPTGRPVGPSN
ncbi:MAG: glycosyltransferase [Patescibacteria group bacterium]|nr:glycosyltransferase [Patescibacteria group bacterium]